MPNRVNILELEQDGDEYVIPLDADEIVLIHGTTASFLQDVLRDGVTPRGMNKNNAWSYIGPGLNSNPNWSYWGDFQTARRAAINACNRWDPPIMYIQAAIPVDILRPDEDIRTDSWRESLARGTCAAEIDHLRSITNILVTGSNERPILTEGVKFI